MSEPPRIPSRHLSVRVPWHDGGWGGTVCSQPRDNGSCLVLQRIHAERIDDEEEQRAGQSWHELKPAELPPCCRERGGFMAPQSHIIELRPAYKLTNKAHAHLELVRVTVPPYTAPCVPYNWLLLDSAGEKSEQYELPFQSELEERAHEVLGFKADWVQSGHNQRVLLDSFFSAVRPEASLCFFYAKRTPLSESSGRVLIGAGRVLGVGHPLEFGRSGEGELDPLPWERMVEHSIRGDFSDGFLLPYQEALDHAAEDDGLDLEEVVAFAPDDHWSEFSHGSEHVSNDAAIASLVACSNALERVEKLLGGSRRRQREWIDARLGELWSMRGPAPGLGAALSAFGIEHGTLVAYYLAPLLKENDDPWPLVDQMFNDPSATVLGLSSRVSKTLCRTWQGLDGERRALLELLSRFDLTAGQASRFYQPTERAKVGIDVSDAELLANPYLLYELDRDLPDPIGVGIVDRATFPSPVVRDKHPLPEPSLVDDPLDPRRVRALLVSQLEIKADRGSTLGSTDDLIQGVRDLSLDPPCPVDSDILGAIGDQLEPPVINVELANGQSAYQLDRLKAGAELIRSEMQKRASGQRHEIGADWEGLLEETLGPISEAKSPEVEQRARKEKIAALEEMAAARVTVLVGSAGTGKTTLLETLARVPEISAGGILLLAPTGKARVRMEMAVGQEAQTIAQFLLPLRRYDAAADVYRVSDHSRESGYRTVVIDECSMLTEEQLAAVIDAVKGVHRLVLVGDHRQLPPIGPGRPFVDIAKHFAGQMEAGEFPRVAPQYAELTVPRRYAARETADGSEARTAEPTERADLMFAEWFSGETPSPAADEIWGRLADEEVSENLRVVSWSTSDELRDMLLAVMVEELGLESGSDSAGFELSIGASEFNGWRYFHPRRANGDAGAADAAEQWQILSPVRAHGHGVGDLNRLLQRQFRDEARRYAEVDEPWKRRVPRPVGPEGILYGDKVINVVNRRRHKVYPKDNALCYVANGEIGVVVGDFKSKKQKWAPKKLEVEFSSQAGFKYDFWPSEFGQDSIPPLELAYVITVHKAQGSEFDVTFLVVPNPCQLLSRELLYTALTRQRDRVVLFAQGDVHELKRFAEPSHSETAARLTNLFSTPHPVAVDDRFLEDSLIHRTVRGEAVRSKSEVVIANMLHDKGIEYVYEQPLRAGDGSVRYPDFTIEDAASGETVYWEHLGMLHVNSYRQRWERKLDWYEAQGVRIHERGGGPAGTLVVTVDDEQGGIDSQGIERLIQDVPQLRD